MGIKASITLFIFILIGVMFTTFSRAGQVVTEDVRLWAKKVIAQEDTFETVSAPNTLAVLYFHNKTKWSKLNHLEKGLAFMLETDLSKLKGVRLVERVKVQAIVEELNLTTPAMVDQETSSRMGRLLNVEHLVSGDIYKSKIDEFQLKSKLLNVSEAKIFGQPETEGKLLEELFKMEKELLFDIIELLQIELTAKQIKELKTPITTNIKALMYLFEAIEYSDKRDYAKAIGFYEKSLNADDCLTWALDGIREILYLDLLNKPVGKPQAYSKAKPNIPAIITVEKPEAYSLPDYIPAIMTGSGPQPFFSGQGPPLEIFDLSEEDRPEERDRTERENNLGKGKIQVAWSFTTEGVDLNETTTQSYSLLSYAVQKENNRLLEMYKEAVEKQEALSSINTALAYADLRIHDECMTRQSDAKIGKVLKDREGNLVRVEQFILRPDVNTVRLLNICQRKGKGENVGLSTMDWKTTFTEGYTGDLRGLPWNKWLRTRTGNDGRYVMTNAWAPELKEMSVKFTNPSEEFLRESRGFNPKAIIADGVAQYINSERFTLLAKDQNPVTYRMGKDYKVKANASGGFKYLFGDESNTINVSFFVVGDTDTTDDGQGVRFKDIWDALRTNEAGSPNIGGNNLEIVIDGQNRYFSMPIEVIYVPMSRMEWRFESAM